MQMNAYGLALVTPRSPGVALWWSVLLPGFGHFYVGSHLKGFVLLAWEAAINNMAHLNLAIYYSILGEPQQAARVLNLEWAILYPFIYLFSIWDAYRLAVEVSKLNQLEELQGHRQFTRIKLHPIWGMNFLEKRNPFTAAFFSILVGGLGHLYNLRIAKAAMLAFWQVLVMVKSHGHEAIAFTLQGRFHDAAAVIDYQWFLFWPSVALFNVVNAYTDAIQLNNLFDDEWEHRLRKYLRNPSWPQRPAKNQ
jgi:hypothetical protein